MDKLKVTYSTTEELPEGFEQLYTERNGRFELTGIEGVKTQSDIDKVTEGLRKERADHKTTKERLQKFGEVDPETLPATLAELEEARARIETLTKEGVLDPTKTEPLISAAVKRALGPVEREKSQLQRDLDLARKTVVEKDAEVNDLKTSAKQRSIELTLRDAAVTGKVIPQALEDVVMFGSRVFDITDDGRILTRDNVSGVTPGLEAQQWLKDMQQYKPHWWPMSQGGGSRGGPGGGNNRAENPWSNEAWNITNQGKYVREHGAEKGAQAAAAMGSKLGATRPPAAAAKPAA